MRIVLMAIAIVAGAVGLEYALWRRAEKKEPSSATDRLRKLNRQLAEGTELQ